MEEERREELIKRLEDFDETHAQWMRRLGLFIGRLQKRFANNPIGRFILKNITTRIMAFLIVRFRLLDIKSGNDAIEIAYEWQKLARFFKVPVEIESATKERVILIHPECTMGFDQRHEKLCWASMNMDKNIVSRLGGELTILERISEGSSRCRHMVTFRR